MFSLGCSGWRFGGCEVIISAKRLFLFGWYFVEKKMPWGILAFVLREVSSVECCAAVYGASIFGVSRMVQDSESHCIEITVRYML